MLDKTGCFGTEATACDIAWHADW